MDIKQFTETKAPKSDQQFTAVVAYFFQFVAPAAHRLDSIDAATMKEAARQAGRRQVNDWNITLNNAKNSGYLDSVGKGRFKLNAVGENLVAMALPANGPSGLAKSGSGKKKPNKKKAPIKKRAKNGN